MLNSHIQWTDNTFNPWIGCTKVSPGCANCYAEVRDQRFAKGIHWGPGAPRHKTSIATWRQPMLWNKQCADNLFRKCDICGAREMRKWVPVGAEIAGLSSCTTPDCLALSESESTGVRLRVFCASLADIFDDEVPIEWSADLFRLIHHCKHLDFQLLTKRPENIRRRLGEVLSHFYKTPGDSDATYWLGQWIIANPAHAPENIWLGTTVENQKMADLRIPELLKIPAKIRFLSCEPLLGPVDIWDSVDQFVRCGGEVAGWTRDNPFMIHWVIAGGESGPHHRDMDPEWAESLRVQCEHAGVPFLMKQMGGYPNKRGELEDMPENLRVREFPQ